MSSDPINAYFEGRAAANHTVVHGAPRLDLETYIANYHGRTQISRLIHIATHSVPLSVEAVKIAIKLLKQGSDVKCYRLAVSFLQKIAPNDPDAKPDEEWADRTTRKVAAETEKMEAALKSYKHNLIKESIRMGHEDLGNHYYASGELPNAFKSYSRMRDFCTAPKHVLDMSLQIIRVCVEQGNYMSVQSHVSKIGNLQRTPDEEEELKPKLAAAMGLANLSNSHYLDAARCFLDCPSTLGNSFNEVISANDVAVYGGLCALASMDRSTLKAEVLDNSNFRSFLELEPQIRHAISYFYTAKYSNCLQILNEYRNDYLLDIHLTRHVKWLYDIIQSKSIVQYFIPFSCVTLASMAEAFDTNETQLEKELVSMIGQGILDARIDTKNRLLVAKETDMRATVHKDTLTMARNYERAARLKLVRVNMVRAGLEVKGVKGQNHAGMPFQEGGRAIGSRPPGFLERFT
ncbi:26S proteasome subunit RPN7-domain-containing protein [Tricharina praecox]|uniref:26S proteasome subunit RPN7-domain-containing protein n=1 Tax=Tricharina praecox TaxID=43433 RepID=UPI0022208FE0|nr:26S proteasome subunit RPN7-domain-containing protein [Tricharina praecox]KAI5856970.1 26S proteasome subunit RPN7-domain-containing protein [Tricharina praecox]